MGNYRFRHYEGPEDAETQYQLWLRATDDLPRAWASNMTNVRHCMAEAASHPQSRIYAENADGEMVGYIGTHMPFEWFPGGWTLPFGFPWTYPVDTGLEADLYDRMFTITPQTYPGMKRNLYVQRFRESWQRQIEFMTARGWQHKWRFPILSHRVEMAATGEDAARLLEAEDIATACAFAVSDPHLRNKPSVDSLRKELDGGWTDWESIWIVPDVGVFGLDVRSPWAEVKLFYADAERFDALLSAVVATARRLAVSEYYFTLEEDETDRYRALVRRGFEEVDAGIYLVFEL
jgi:hypothetical protein